MEFKDFASLMRPYVGVDVSGSSPKVVMKLFDQITDYSNLKERPYSENEGTLRKYFNGSSSIRLVAKNIISNLDKKKFQEFVDSFLPDTKTQLAKDLNNSGYAENVDRGQVARICTNLFVKVLHDSSLQKNIKIKKSTPKKIINGVSKINIHNVQDSIWIDASNNTLVCGGIKIHLPDKLEGYYVMSKQEDQKYVQEFLKAYADKINGDMNFHMSISNLPKSVSRYLQIQCNFYNDAEWVKRSLRDTIEDFDSEYEQLKDDVFNGVSVEYFQDWENGYERMRKTLEQATKISLDKSSLKNINNLLGNGERQGLCHVLINEGNRINSWVVIDDD